MARKRLRPVRGGSIVIVVAAVVAMVPASFAQAPRITGQGKSAGTVSVAVPIGKVSVGPESLEGEPVYVRRTTVGAGMTVVEVSTTPFMPVPPSKQERAKADGSTVRPDRPASW